MTRGAGLLESDPLAANHETWAGDNLLGFILTQARDMFSAQAAAPPPTELLAAELPPTELPADADASSS